MSVLYVKTTPNNILMTTAQENKGIFPLCNRTFLHAISLILYKRSHIAYKNYLFSPTNHREALGTEMSP